MKITFKLLAPAIFAALFSFSNIAFSEPPNLTLLTKDIQNYHDSGQYEKELAEAIMKAREYINKQAESNDRNKEHKKLAIVLDIDETSLSNYGFMAKRGFFPTREQLREEIAAANAPAIKPMLSLYHDAMKHGVSVFFVTGRPFNELQATKTNLLRAGYKNWAGLYLRPEKYHSASIVNFKAKTRAQINEHGYTVIATIGDQYSDLLGGFAKKEFKLPNPFYYLP